MNWQFVENKLEFSDVSLLQTCDRANTNKHSPDKRCIFGTKEITIDILKVEKIKLEHSVYIIL